MGQHLSLIRRRWSTALAVLAVGVAMLAGAAVADGHPARGGDGWADSAGGSGANSVGVLQVPGGLLDASFSYAPATPIVGDPVTFTSTSTVPQNDSVTATWELNGDAVSFDDATGSTVSYVFTTPGAHAVGLRIRDQHGFSSTSWQTVVVAPNGGSTAGSGPGSARVEYVPSPDSRIPPPIIADRTPVRLTPSPVVRIRAIVRHRGVRLTLLSVAAPAGSSVTIRCRGRGCPHSTIATVARSSSPITFKPLQRHLRPGATIEVFVTRAGTVGKYTRLVVRKHGQPLRSDGCALPGTLRPAACPVA